MGMSRKVERAKWKEHAKRQYVNSLVQGTQKGTPRFIQVKVTNWKAWRKFTAQQRLATKAKVAIDQVPE